MKITSRSVVIATLIGIISYTIVFLFAHDHDNWTITLTDYVNEILIFVLTAIIIVSIINKEKFLIIGTSMILIMNSLFALDRHNIILFDLTVNPVVALIITLVIIVIGVIFISIGLTKLIKQSIAHQSLQTLIDQTNRAFYFEYNNITKNIHIEFTDSFISYYSMYERTLDMTVDEFKSYIHEDNLKDVNRFNNQEKQSKPMQSYYRVKFPQMTDYIWIYSKSTPTTGHVFRSVGFDFSETQNLINKMTEKEKELNYSKQDLNFIINHSNDFIVKYDKEGKLNYASDSFLNFFDVEEKDIIGKTYEELDDLFQIADDSWYSDVLKENMTTDLVKSEFKGKVYWINWHNHIIKNEEGTFEFLLSIGTNLTEMMNLNEKLDFDSKHDQLTKLLNRRGLYAKSSQLREQNYRLYFIDIHHFMMVNEYYGANAGDNLIIQIANTLKDLDPNLLVTRYEGDEFILVANDQVNHNKLLDKLSVIQDKTYYYNDIQIPIHLHIGYAVKRQNESLSNVITNAALAMTRSRQLNTLQIVDYKHSMGTQLKEKIVIIQKLKNSIKKDLFHTHFQAIMNSDQELVMIESLARWSDKEIGYISPQAFFQVAKEASMIYELDYYLITKSINYFSKIHQQTDMKHAICSINFTMETLFQEDVIARLAEHVKSLGLSTSSICIEITESTFVHNVDFLLKQIKKMKKYGFLIAIDDFGKEYSSLLLIKTLDVDYIKIDKAFIKNLDDKSNIAIIKMVIEIANIQGSKVIVEGIESKEQFTLLNEIGCDYFQGFYFEKPRDYLSVNKKD